MSAKRSRSCSYWPKMNIEMFMMIVLGVASLVVVGSSVLLLDCSLASVSLFAGDPLQVCATVDSLGLGASPALMTGFAAFGLLAVVGSWLEAYRRFRKAKVEPVNSLARNLDRIEAVLPHDEDEPSDAIGSTDVTTEQTEDELSAAWAELDALEHLFASDDQSSENFSARWLDLIRLANDLHNRGQIETDDFKVMNTRILDLLPAPRREAALATS